MKRHIIILLFLLIATLGLYGEKQSGTKGRVKGIDDFYKKTRFIMTKMEKRIYKHLVDDIARQEFIKDFWDKRDPTPDNFENEAKKVYAERIAYANRWFNEGTGKNAGWDTERGRILLQLGIPDRREFGDLDMTARGRGRLLTTKRLPMERWFYFRFQLYLVFTDNRGFGKFRLSRIPAQLLTAVDLAKMSILDSSRADLKHQLTFKSSIKKESILLKIPTKKISFEEKDGKMGAKFSIIVYVYKKYKRYDVINTKRVLENINNSILSKKNIYFSIPLKYEKGKYRLEIIVEDIVGQSKYRNILKYKVR